MTLETVHFTVAERRRLRSGVVIDDDKPTPVMFDHCAAVYDRMCELAEEGEEGLVYEGHLTKLVSSLGLPGPYYSLIRKNLRMMGSIEQLRRGGGNSPSRWRLGSKPTEESFNSLTKMNSPRGGKIAALEQQLRDLGQRVRRLEETVK